jgi:hypothetical protein
VRTHPAALLAEEFEREGEGLGNSDLLRFVFLFALIFAARCCTLHLHILSTPTISSKFSSIAARELLIDWLCMFIRVFKVIF